ncbi:MAG: DUF3343 domain-containing protein [Deltaproteobacteria bacterium]|nr:DUF3343 domain-containing protein [Deltaproteobacteria bacterium]
MYILTFASTHRVLKAESILKTKDISFRLDPAPSVLSTYCDLVISINEGALDLALKVLGENDESPKSIYIREGEEYICI